MALGRRGRSARGRPEPEPGTDPRLAARCRLGPLTGAAVDQVQQLGVEARSVGVLVLHVRGRRPDLGQGTCRAGAVEAPRRLVAVRESVRLDRAAGLVTGGA